MTRTHNKLLFSYVRLEECKLYNNTFVVSLYTSGQGIWFCLIFGACVDENNSTLIKC